MTEIIFPVHIPAEEEHSKIIKVAPDAIVGSKLPALDRLTHYNDPIVFTHDDDMRLLFAEIANQESVSDIIIKPGDPVMIKRKRRGLSAITYRIMQRQECEYLARKLTNNNSFLIKISEGECLSGQAKMLDGNIVDDADYEAQADQVSSGERARFRYEVTGCSSALSEQSFSVILRPLADEPMTYDKLGISEQFVKDCIVNDGIVVIGGATGEGKSTTLAAVIRYIMENDTDIKGIILTHEDPIEINYDRVKSKHSVIIQSSIGQGQNIKSFHDANRSAMRRSPDLVLVGELRDGDTVDAAVELSFTGHPVFATTHANSVAAIFPRLVSRFPQEIQAQKALDLIDTMRMLVSQKLIEGSNGKMFAVREVLKFTPELREYLKFYATTPDILNRKITNIMRYGLFGAESYENQGKRLLEEGKIGLRSYRYLVEERQEFDEETLAMLDKC